MIRLVAKIMDKIMQIPNIENKWADDEIEKIMLEKINA